MKNITIILPVYKLDSDDIEMLHKALLSVEDFHNDVKIIVVCPSYLKSIISGIDFGQKLEVKIIYNSTSKTDFCTQINIGIDECNTEWFSILEIDDEYNKIWLSSMNEYIKSFNDVDVFLPVVKDVNVEGKFLGFSNESVWAYGFSDRQGYLDNSLLLEYQNFQTSGGLYRTKVIIDNGKFKDNIKLTFSYEFLLRLTYNGVNIMSVPRIGYLHVNLCENSLFWKYKYDENESLSENEAEFWLETAKKEYFFKNKRDIVFKKP